MRVIIKKLCVLLFLFFVTNCSNNSDGVSQNTTPIQKPDSKKDVNNIDYIKDEELKSKIKDIIDTQNKTIIEVKNTGDKEKNNENNNTEKIKEIEKIIETKGVSEQDKLYIKEILDNIKNQDNSNNISPVKDEKNEKELKNEEKPKKDSKEKTKEQERQEYIHKVQEKINNMTSLDIKIENIKIDIENDPMFNVLNIYVLTNKDFEDKRIPVSKLLEKINNTDKLKSKMSSSKEKYNKKFNLKISKCPKCGNVEDCECDKSKILTETDEIIKSFHNNYSSNKTQYQELSIEYQRAIVVRLINFVDLLFDKFKFCLFQRVDGHNNEKIKNNIKGFNFKIESNIGNYVDIKLNNKINKNDKNGLLDNNGKIRGTIYNKVANLFTLEDLKIIEEQYLQKIPTITNFIKEKKVEKENKDKSQSVYYEYYFDFESDNDENFIKTKYKADIQNNQELTESFNEFLNNACLNMINKFYVEKLKEKNKNKCENDDKNLQFQISTNHLKHFIL